MKRIAKCCCEQAGIEVQGEPELNLVCHCDSCKRATGSAFGISVYFKDEQIVRTFGETSVYEKTNWLGDQKRYFCKICGTRLYWTLSEMAGLTGVAGGCFTDDPLPEPNLTVTQGDKMLPWLKMPEHWDTSIEALGRVIT